MMQVILPERSHGIVAAGLRLLTQALYEAHLVDTSESGLGGPFGYGADFENDVFMLHPFCWCEKEDCKWCSGTGPKEVAHFGGTVAAPNFLHKPTGFKVWWYKWIGRGMEIENPLGVEPLGVLADCLDAVAGKQDKGQKEKP